VQIRAREDDLNIARILYRAMVGQYPDRVVLLCERARILGAKRPAGDASADIALIAADLGRPPCLTQHSRDFPIAKCFCFDSRRKIRHRWSVAAFDGVSASHNSGADQQFMFGKRHAMVAADYMCPAHLQTLPLRWKGESQAASVKF
jgi:hypothetical protein